MLRIFQIKRVCHICEKEFRDDSPETVDAMGELGIFQAPICSECDKTRKKLEVNHDA